MLCTGNNGISRYMSYPFQYDASNQCCLLRYSNNSVHREHLDTGIATDRQLSNTDSGMTAIKSRFMVELAKELNIKAGSCPAQSTFEPEVSSHGRLDQIKDIHAPKTKPMLHETSSVFKSVGDAGLACIEPSKPKYWYAGYPLAADTIAVGATMVISALTVSFMFIEMSEV
ncbi:hypothetical protein LTR10_022217 [Elasticomyces elasticus]|uniref:Uncharacterized protein n=1 Tax=Exophiala sideris TaxID=1016849 RepID=A0ABR0JK07_9EURO|nr:hypothetical protein LTR10_022217 [Elasticomyces elasticus]KAK5034395.1 hypothetical protein LTS07_003316 [Exophiala sideris]KAK5042692.1 hypothetical protein LTR13_001540 [Exophiala sideris]KAK5065774.1 hypothetical protein LTR69_003324 [Exophiala sideris]KAK5185766.1 hypothetical protein LTR44_001815 [Eurotiomycetes sp. CCFEE 6388]